MTPRERAEASAAILLADLRKIDNRHMSGDRADIEEWSIESRECIAACLTEHVRALLTDDEAEAIICAVGVKHQLNIHPAIARDIAAALRRKAGI